MLPESAAPGARHSSRVRQAARSTAVSGRRWQRRLSMIAAVLVAALLVSSLLLVLTGSHRKSGGVSSPKPSGGLPPMLSLHMIDASTGWALTERAVLSTTDGGAHW